MKSTAGVATAPPEQRENNNSARDNPYKTGIAATNNHTCQRDYVLLTQRLEICSAKHATASTDASPSRNLAKNAGEQHTFEHAVGTRRMSARGEHTWEINSVLNVRFRGEERAHT